MSERNNWMYGYLRLKKEKVDLLHELELRVEYEEDLRLHIEKLEKQVQLCLGDALALTDRAINDGLTLVEVESLLREVY